MLNTSKVGRHAAAAMDALEADEDLSEYEIQRVAIVVELEKGDETFVVTTCTGHNRAKHAALLRLGLEARLGI